MERRTSSSPSYLHHRHLTWIQNLRPRRSCKLEGFVLLLRVFWLCRIPVNKDRGSHGKVYLCVRIRMVKIVNRARGYNDRYLCLHPDRWWVGKPVLVSTKGRLSLDRGGTIAEGRGCILISLFAVENVKDE